MSVFNETCFKLCGSTDNEESCYVEDCQPLPIDDSLLEINSKFNGYMYVHCTYTAIYCYTSRVRKKIAFSIFAHISTYTKRRETSRLSIELSGNELLNGMRLDFLRNLVSEKIGNLCKILTLAERTITPL